MLILAHACSLYACSILACKIRQAMGLPRSDLVTSLSRKGGRHACHRTQPSSIWSTSGPARGDVSVAPAHLQGSARLVGVSLGRSGAGCLRCAQSYLSSGHVGRARGCWMCSAPPDNVTDNACRDLSLPAWRAHRAAERTNPRELA